MLLALILLTVALIGLTVFVYKSIGATLMV
jgi:hypothetical protein